MNSAQRRKTAREHPHVVTLRATEHDRYFHLDDRVDNARRWCRKQCKGSWRTIESWDCTEFKFSNQKDAVYFALKWS